MSAVELHKLRVQHLYRRSLKTMLSWACDRDVFWEEAERIRGQFEANKQVTERRQVEALFRRAEAQLWKFAHPDPYIVPYRPGGSLYARNPPWDSEMHRQPDFGREPGFAVDPVAVHAIYGH